MVPSPSPPHNSSLPKAPRARRLAHGRKPRVGGRGRRRRALEQPRAAEVVIMNCVEGGILGSDRKAYSPKCLGLSSGGAGGWDRRCALRLATATTPLSASRSTVGEAADAGEVYVVQVSSRVWVVGPERPLEAERLVIEPGVVLGLPHPVPLDDVIKPPAAPAQHGTLLYAVAERCLRAVGSLTQRCYRDVYGPPLSGTAVVRVGVAMNVVESFDFPHYLQDFGVPVPRVMGPVDSQDVPFSWVPTPAAAGSVAGVMNRR
jgi:hypothetical protein